MRQAMARLPVGKLAALLGIFPLLTLSAVAGQAVLAWDPSTSSNVASYNVYYGQASGSYAAKLSIPNQTSYTVPGLSDGRTYYFAVTAVDAAGVESVRSNEASFTVPAVAVTPVPTTSAACPCSIWGANATPTNVAESDGGAVNLGVKFTSSQSGYITGIRFYKGATNTGTHVGSLWTASGQLLASATFTGETASGWQQVNFATPVMIAANTTYVASYFAPNGHYAGDGSFFNAGSVSNGPLSALGNGVNGANGVFKYATTSAFTSDSWNATNYWVDVVFKPTTAATASSPTSSLWSSTATPVNAADSDSGAVNLGVKFSSSQAGYIKGLRFYKGATNTGTHVGSLWTSSGQLLASATFTNETASGWQQVNFATPVPIMANTVYVASYLAPNGHYAGDGGFFATAGVTNGPLTALRNGASGANSVFKYGSTSTFPTDSWNATNYWVDVVFGMTK